MSEFAKPEAVLAFWLDEVGEAGWYKQDDALDETVRARFGQVWSEAMQGSFSLWMTYPSGALAYIILTDQFPRNMFRGEAQAFASDKVSRAVAKRAISQGYDRRIDAPARQFFYLPLMHSESLGDQDRCVRLICERMPESEDNLVHAKAHREIIRKYGRFPFRNVALSRRTTPAEQAFVDDGGYGEILRSFQKKAAA